MSYLRKLAKLTASFRAAGMAVILSAGAGLAASDEALISASDAALQSASDEAMLSGSGRLLFATLGRDQPEGGTDIYRQNGYLFGLGYRGKPERLLTSIQISPVLYWDPNVNNGLAQDRLLVSGMEFTLPSEMVAKSGLVYGIEANASQRWAIGPGLTLQPDIGLILSHTSAWDRPLTAARASLCEVQTAEAGRWTTLCLQQSHYSDGASRTVNQTDLVLGQDIFLGGDLGGPAHLLGMTGRRSFLPEGHRDSFGLRLTSAWPGFGSTDLSAEIGEVIPGIQSRTRFLGLGLTRMIRNRPTEFSVYADRREGEYFLGDQVVDQGIGIGIARPVNDHLKVEVMFEKNRSSAKAYDSSGLSVRFSLPSLSMFR